MALFAGKRDQDLPLLTQVQQIQLWDKDNKPDDKELMEFALTWTYNNRPVVQMVRQGDENFDFLREACLLSQRILHALATEKVEGELAFDVADKRKFSELLKQIPTYAPSLLPAGGSEQEYAEQEHLLAQPSGLIRARWVKYWDWKQGSATRVLAATILQDLGDLFDHIEQQYYTGAIAFKTPVALCEECKNAYVVQRFGQQFCSHKCGNTAGSRRRYVTKKKSSVVDISLEEAVR